ncbi:hypothetical protein EVAR_2729_1 [Eumeta japonica]|uniref:Uncharacterized protein n=1 Tax=Eumeta variegata TaxID=151549 RepID=A0A4C1T2U5_EUMVA|nr:hypothetical protein EVAR_2729_1 [Eumeta japonica]
MKCQKLRLAVALKIDTRLRTQRKETNSLPWAPSRRVELTNSVHHEILRSRPLRSRLRPDPACARADCKVVPGGLQLLRNSRGRDLGSASHPCRARHGDRQLTCGTQGSCLSPCLYAVFTDKIPTLTGQLLAGQIACRRKYDEDGRLIDRLTTYHATEAETARTGSGMADQTLAWYALCSTPERKRIQAQQNIALQVIVGAGQYVLSDVITRDLCIETLEEFIQNNARWMYDIAHQGYH